MTDLVVLGLSHKTAPVELRERFDLSKASPHEYLSKVSKLTGIQGGVVLSTCNRVEVYLEGDGILELQKAAFQFFKGYHSSLEEDALGVFYRKENQEAVRHLFRVASSLDSLVVGEPQILGQVKEAYYAAHAHELTTPFLDRLLRKALTVAKKVRTETRIAGQAVSVSFAAVELAKKVFGELKNKKVLLLGGGEMAELAAKHLQKEDLGAMYFTNRSYEHSVDLAKSYGGLPVRFDQYLRYMKEADIVIVSTSAPHYIVTQEKMASILQERRQEPIFLIDISVPRNVDPALEENENVYLFNIDDLQQVVKSNLTFRQEEATKAEEIVASEVLRFYQRMERQETAPLIRELQGKYERVKEEEIQRLLGRLGEISDRDRQEIKRFSETLLRKFLNDPILFLKEEGTDEDSTQRFAWLKRVFQLRSKVND